MSQPLIVSFRSDAAQMCLDGRKPETRRIYDPAKRIALLEEEGDTEIGVPLYAIYSRDGKGSVTCLWRVGEFIAIKPSSTEKAIGRVLCTSLRVEHVQDITEEGARREGMTVCPPLCADSRCAWWQHTQGGIWFETARDAFCDVWQRLYPTGPKSWEANPLVAVIGFEPVEEGK